MVTRPDVSCMLKNGHLVAEVYFLYLYVCPVRALPLQENRPLPERIQEIFVQEAEVHPQ
jgi:hypothetical protein